MRKFITHAISDPFNIFIIVYMGAMLAGIGVVVAAVLTHGFGEPCWIANSIECHDKQVQECLALERYTRDECIILAGGG